MPVSLDLVTLVLYFVQQLGVMLGVGAQTIYLITYALSVRDGVVDAKESQIAFAVQKALLAGLALMILSGVAIVILHFMLGEWFIILAPAFVFKWILIIFLLFMTFVWSGKPFPNFVSEGLIGASWYALFVLHTLAPVAAWFDLLVLYVIWTAGYLLLWSAGIFMIPKKPKALVPMVLPKDTPPAPKPAPVTPPVIKPIVAVVPPPPPAPKPKAPAPAPVPLVVAKAPPLPVLIQKEEKKILPPPIITTVLPPHPPVAWQPNANVAQKRIETVDSLEVPALRVMPRTPEDAQRHLNPVVPSK